MWNGTECWLTFHHSVETHYSTGNLQKQIHTLCTWILIKHVISPWCRFYASLNLVNIGSDNGLLPIWHQAIIYTIAGIYSVGPIGTNFSVVLIWIRDFSFTKMHFKNHRQRNGGHLLQGVNRSSHVIGDAVGTTAVFVGMWCYGSVIGLNFTSQCNAIDKCTVDIPFENREKNDEPYTHTNSE